MSKEIPSREDLVEEMRELSILKALLDEVPYERYIYFSTRSENGKDCVYARKAVEFYKTYCRDKIIGELEKCSNLLPNPAK